MPDELYDQDGYAYEKNWAGQWTEKRGLFGGHVRDSGPAYGYESASGGLFGGQKYSWDGKQLYQRRDEGGSSGDGSGIEGALAFLLLLVYLAALALTLAVVAAPILAPLFLKHSETLGQQGKTDEAKKWQGRGRLVSLAAILVVPILASSLVVGAAAVLMAGMEKGSTGGAEILYALGVIITPLLVVPLSVAGLYPTATQYLRHFSGAAYSHGISSLPTRFFGWIVTTVQTLTAKVKLIFRPSQEASCPPYPSSLTNTESIGSAPISQPLATLISLHGQSYPVTMERFSIGRSKTCDLQLNDRSASRRHARLCYVQGAWFVQDQGSTGGTFVNGRPQKAIRLNPGDELRIGNSTFVFYVEK